MKRSESGMIGVFMARLAAVGGSFAPVEVQRERKEHAQKFGPNARALSERDYFTVHGTVYRRKPKDRTISGRQARIKRKEARRAQ
jgi:hypothetical protein